MPIGTGEAQIMHKGFHVRCCKGSVFSSQGVPTLNVSKNIKATFLMFLLFIYLNKKYDNVTC